MSTVSPNPISNERITFNVSCITSSRVTTQYLIQRTASEQYTIICHSATSLLHVSAFAFSPYGGRLQRNTAVFNTILFLCEWKFIPLWMTVEFLCKRPPWGLPTKAVRRRRNVAIWRIIIYYWFSVCWIKYYIISLVYGMWTTINLQMCTKQRRSANVRTQGKIYTRQMQLSYFIPF